MGIGDRPGGGGWAGRLRTAMESRAPYHPKLGKIDFVTWHNMAIAGIGSITAFSLLPELRIRRTQTAIIAVGINDCVRVVANGRTVVTPLMDASSWNVVLRELGQTSADIYVVGLPPIDETRMPIRIDDVTELYWDAVIVSRYNRMIMQLCKKYGVPFIDISRAWTVSKRHSDDGVHPNAHGYDAIYRQIRRQMGLNFGKTGGKLRTNTKKSVRVDWDTATSRIIKILFQNKSKRAQKK